MAKILYIKANPKSNKDSITFQMSEKFMEEYQKNHPEDEIITLDLYQEGIRFLSGHDLNDMFSDHDFDVKQYAIQFSQADKYVIAAPFWNLSIPAILKAYLDYITFVGITFQYTEDGPEGLLKNKKMLYFVARGGTYTAPPMENYEMGERYLRTLMGFLGVFDFQTVACELTNVLQGKDLTSVIENGINNAVQAAKEF